MGIRGGHGVRRDRGESTVQKTYRWIRELDEELGGVGRQESYQVLRGFLQTLRDRLIVDEAAQLAAQLPMLVRGIYYEGWDPSKAPWKMSADEFRVTVRDEADDASGELVFEGDVAGR